MGLSRWKLLVGGMMMMMTTTRKASGSTKGLSFSLSPRYGPSTQYHSHHHQQQQHFARRRGISTTTALRLNRLLFERDEISTIGKELSDSLCEALLNSEDYRTVHVKEILKAKAGDTVRVGVIDGAKIEEAPITWEGNGSLRIALGSKEEALKPPPEEERPRVDLILAMQAPLRMERLVPHIAALGVGKLIITSASKVEKSYWGSHLLREPKALRELVKEGLTQAGDTMMPEILIERRLKVFLEDDLDRLSPPRITLRVIAHPFRNLPDSPAVSTRIRDLIPPCSADEKVVEKDGEGRRERPRIVLAIGPESGWQEPYELNLFQSYGFQQCTLGKRVLRTETAVPALLSLAHDYIDALDKNGRPPAA